MMTDKPDQHAQVFLLNGAQLPEPGQPNRDTVAVLEDLLEMARSGEIIGVSVAMMHADRSCAYRVVGVVGGYSMIGAMEMGKQVVIDINLDVVGEAE